MTTTPATEQLVDHACAKAMQSCISQLRELGWLDCDIENEVDALLPMIRAEVHSTFPAAVEQLNEGLQSAARNYAMVLFNLEFVLAGNRAARAFDAAAKAAAEELRDRRFCIKAHG
jgi:hypothetical protein